mmetsp:Transcript_33162/g.83609  ORF Transcript_33162/g.83609 Transcript_33162/m.83609 type:complete len:401 (-) Transcript_33162:351-1553(-)
MSRSGGAVTGADLLRLGCKLSTSPHSHSHSSTTSLLPRAPPELEVPALLGLKADLEFSDSSMTRVLVISAYLEAGSLRCASYLSPLYLATRTIRKRMLMISSMPGARLAAHSSICPCAASLLNGCICWSPEMARGSRRRSFGRGMSSPVKTLVALSMVAPAPSAVLDTRSSRPLTGCTTAPTMPVPRPSIKPSAPLCWAPCHGRRTMPVKPHRTLFAKASPPPASPSPRWRASCWLCWSLISRYSSSRLSLATWLDMPPMARLADCSDTLERRMRKARVKTWLLQCLMRSSMRMDLELWMPVYSMPSMSKVRSLKAAREMRYPTEPISEAALASGAVPKLSRVLSSPSMRSLISTVESAWTLAGASALPAPGRLRILCMASAFHTSASHMLITSVFPTRA